MTLTTLSSKEFQPLFKWAFKRNRAIMTIYSVMLGLGILLNLYVIATDGYYTDDEVAPAVIILFGAGAAFFTFISALKTFSFLHNKRSVDMFGALPTNRTTMLVSHLAAGLSAIALPFTIASILEIGISARSGDSFRNSIIILFATYLMMIASYAFTALIAYCCGTIVDTAIITIALNGIWVGIIGFFTGIMSEIIPGCSFESVIENPLLTALAPYSFAVIDAFYVMDGDSISAVVAAVVWQLIFTAGVLFLAWFASNKRKAETSQNGFAFKWLPMVVKAGSSIVAGSMIGFIAAETSDSGYGNMYVFGFWYVVIGFVAFLVLHLIFSRGRKEKFGKSAIVFGATSLATLIVVFSMTYGLGIDTYVPTAENVKSVEFGYYTYKEPENIKTITEIHQVIADNIQDANEYPYYLGSNYDNYNYNYSPNPTYVEDAETTVEETEYSKDDFVYGGGQSTEAYIAPEPLPSENKKTKNYPYVNHANFTFRYTKKVGFRTERNYYISGYSDYKYYDMDKLESLVKQLFSSDEYKKNVYPELWREQKPKNIKLQTATLKYYISSDYSSTNVKSYTLPLDEEFLDGLLAAYKEDLLADNEFLSSEVGRYDYSTQEFEKSNYMVIQIQYERTSKRRSYDDDFSFYQTYNVKSTYKNTFDYLEKNGITKADLKSTNPAHSEYDYQYEVFGTSGDIDALQILITDMGTFYEYTSLEELGLLDDYNEWHRKYYDDYIDELCGEAWVLFEDYNKDDKYKDPNYTNEYIKEYGFGEYYQIEDKILEDLQKYSTDYIKSIMNKSSDSDASDKDKDSDSDKDTDTTKKEKDSDTDTDTIINTNSMVEAV